MMRRTLVHEAQHVVMAQRGSDWRAYDALAVTPEAAKHHYGAAARLCNTVPNTTPFNSRRRNPQPQTTRGLDEDSSYLGQELAAANDRFQVSPQNVRELRDEVYAACMHFWTSVAYWAAQLRQDDAIADVPPDVTQLEAWQRYVGDAWAARRRP